MNHYEWQTEITRLMSQNGSELHSLRCQWDELLAKTDAAMRKSIQEWHVQQTLSLYSQQVRERAELDNAAELDERIGCNAEAQVKYWHTAAGTALAQAAMDRFKLGDDDHRAFDLARRALAHRDQIQDSASIYDTLEAKLRERGQL